MSGGGGSSKDGAATTLRCSAGIVVTCGSSAGEGTCKSESLPSQQCLLTISKSSGILAGHKWSIRHEDLDYSAFRRDNARYMHIGDGNNDNGSSNGSSGSNIQEPPPHPLLVIQTRPAGCSRDGGMFRRFECRPSPSLPSGQIIQFVRALVKIHEKWRSKHPGKAQRLDGASAAACRVGRGGGIGSGTGTGTGSGTAGTIGGNRKKQKKTAVSRNNHHRRDGNGGDDEYDTNMHRERREQLKSLALTTTAAATTQQQEGGQNHTCTRRGGRITQLVAARHKGATGTASSGSGGSSRKRKKGSNDKDDDRKELATDDIEQQQPTPMDRVNTDDDEHDNDVEEVLEEVKSEKLMANSNSKAKSKAPNHLLLCVDTNASEAEAEALLQTAEKGSSGATCTTTTTSTAATATSTAATATATAGDSKGGGNNNNNNNNKKAKTVTPTPTASTASRKEQQTQQQNSQQGQQQPGILNYFGIACNAAGDGTSTSTTARTKKKTKTEKEKESKITSASPDPHADADGNMNEDTRKVEDTNDRGNENGSGDEDSGNEKSQMDTASDDTKQDDDDDDVIDVTDHQAKSKSKFEFSGSPAQTNSSTKPVPPGGTTTTKLNRRRNVYGSGRPSASSRQARGGVDRGLVRSPSIAAGGGIGPPSKKKRPATTTTMSPSVNEDPFTFDDGKPTPTSYLPATDLTSRLMGTSTPNRTYGRTRSSSASPSKKSPGPGSRLLFPSKNPRNATPSRIGPTSSSFDRPVGGRRFGGKELLAQHKRAEEEEEPITDEDEYQRAADQSDDATVAIDDDRSWDANSGTSIPATPPTVRRTGYNRESIMPGRLPHSRRGGRSRDDYGSPVHRRATSAAHSCRSPQSWGSALRTTAKKSTGVVREAPYDNFGESPDTLGAVRKLDDRFGRCESPMEEDEEDGLYDTDDEKSRKKMKRLANNPYYPPGSRTHNRDRLENEQQSRYFNDHQMSTADSALLPRGPMRGGLGRGRRLLRHGHSMRATRLGRHEGTPYQQRALCGQDDYSDRNSWDRINSDRKGRSDFFNKRGRGIDRAAERAKDNVATGLRNLGNTCYLNSSLQTLFSVPGFANDLRSTRDFIIAKCDSRHDDASKAKLPLTNALIDTALDLGVLSSEESVGQQAGEDDAEGGSRPSSHNQNMFANSKELKKAIDTLTDLFHGYQQQDAHEAIGYIIDALHDELAGATKAIKVETIDKANGGANDEDILLPTDKYFRLEFREQNICIDCGFTSGDITSVHRNLPIAISKDENTPWTVQETLERHFAPETRELKCEKCPCKKAHHTTRVMKKPGALLLSFKRFVQEMRNTAVDHQDKPVLDKENENVNGGGTDKDMPSLEGDNAPAANSAPPAAAAYVMPTIIRSKVRVCLQEKVSLEPFMLKGIQADAPPSKSNFFDAVGIVHHIGSTPHSGHYTADAVRNRDFGLFDDSRLEEGEKKWVTFDDTATNFTDKTTVLDGETSQRNTYMAMYVAE